jgi:hypothetical protein
MKPIDSNMAKESEDKGQRIKKAIWWSVKWLALIALIRLIVLFIFSC